MSPAGWVAVAAACAALAVWLRWLPPQPGGRVPASSPPRRLPSPSRRARVRPQGLTHLLGALASELSAGQPPTMALEEAAHRTPEACPRALLAARTGGDVAAALREDAEHGPDPRSLRALAACWEVGDSGAGLARAIGQVAEGARARERARAQLGAELAAVRATALLLAALPVVGLLIGQWIGADPLTWLLGQGIGRAVLTAGLALEGAGAAWLRHLVRSVEARL